MKLSHFSTTSLVTLCVFQDLICISHGEVMGHLHLARVKKDNHRDEGKIIAATCPKYDLLRKQKALIVKRIHSYLDKIQKTHEPLKADKKYQITLFQIFEKELNQTEAMIVDSFVWLTNVMKKGYFWNMGNLRESSQARLEALRDATLKEEQDNKLILAADEHFQQSNHTKIEGIFDEVLQEVSDAADKLESGLEDHVFDNAMMDPHLAKGANIETVIRLEGDAPSGGVDPNNNHSQAQKENSVIKLVDAHDNQYVLTKGKDSTVPHEDHHFIQDLVVLLIVCFVFGWLCTLLSLPTMFGYIVSGVLLGPSGYNILKSLVQIETLGEFGVFFILFAVGLEFSPAKLKKVFRVATVGTSSMMFLMLCAGLGIGYILNASLRESTFIASCLSLSSTPLVVKFLHQSSEEESSDSPSGTDYGTVLMGILIMQDVLLGLLMAVLPNMAMEVSRDDSTTAVLANYGLIFLNLAGALAVIFLICWFLSRYLIGRLYKYLMLKGDREILLLATVTVAFLTLLGTNLLHVSMELGCFIAGVMISAQGHQLGEYVENLVQPVKDFLSCLFFSSIGLHVFPQFLAKEMTIITSFTLMTVGTKYLISVIVLAMLVPRSAWHVKWIVSAGLSQVSEFSFVLGSRARRLGLITREVYLLILGITTLSLLFAPVLWKITLWQLRVKPPRSSATSALSTEPVREETLPTRNILLRTTSSASS